MSELRTIADIVIGIRHRSDMGDIPKLADSIREVGLLHPIGITHDGELIFGLRRLRACELLGWTEISVTVINIASVALGERHENEERKDLTVSERVAIMETIRLRPRGQHRSSSEDLPTREQAAKSAGFGNTTTAREARTIVEQGIPELVEAVDAKNLAVEPAFAIARQTPARQAEILGLPEIERRAIVRGIMRPGKNNGSPRRKPAKPESTYIDVPYRPIKFPTREEMGAPPPGSSLAEHDAFFTKYGRTPLHPKTVADALALNEEVNALMAAIIGVGAAAHPDADRFFDNIDQLLDWERKPDKTNGEQTDFAGKARKTVEMLERSLPKALALLTALAAKLRDRKADKGEQSPEDQLPVRLLDIN